MGGQAVLLLILLGMISTSESGRILAIIPSPHPSYQIWNRALVSALLERGHNMTVLSPDADPAPHPNKKEILLRGSYDLVKSGLFNEEMQGKSYFGIMRHHWSKSIQMCNHQFHTEGVMELLRMAPDSFDLILIETILNDCFYLFIHHFGGGIKVPVVGMTAVGAGPWTNGIMGLRLPPSVSPIYVLPYTHRMSLWQRFWNTLLVAFHSFGYRSMYLPAHQKMAEEIYGKSIPPLEDLGSNISLILANNHPVVNGLPVKPSGVVEVGGMHCEESKTLPLNLLQFVNRAEKGIVYVSVGEAMARLPEYMEQSMINAFAELGPKIRFLWRYDAEHLENPLPKNVLAQKWMPQKDILGHPKTLLFVSHGGLLSAQEAVFHGMPIVGIPFSGEHIHNINYLVTFGAAVKLDYESLSKESLLDGINTILRNTSFRRKVHRLSSTFRDQPENPVDRAIFWTEYALRQRTGRIEHFHSPAKEITWFTYYMFDVLTISIVLILFWLVCMYYAYVYFMVNVFSNERMGKSYKPNKKRK